MPPRKRAAKTTTPAATRTTSHKVTVKGSTASCSCGWDVTMTDKAQAERAAQVHAGESRRG